MCLKCVHLKLRFFLIVRLFDCITKNTNAGRNTNTKTIYFRQSNNLSHNFFFPALKLKITKLNSTNKYYLCCQNQQNGN